MVVVVEDKDTAPSAAPGALSVGVPNGWNADDSTFGILFRCLKISQIIHSKRRSSSSTAPHSVRDCSLSRISLSRYVRGLEPADMRILTNAQNIATARQYTFQWS